MGAADAGSGAGVMAADQSELHNKLAGEIVSAIVKPIIASGGGYTDVLVLTESVVMGVVLVAVKLGGDDKVLDVLIDGVKKRLAEQRLGGIKTAGSA